MVDVRIVPTLRQIHRDQWDEVLSGDGFYSSHGWLLSREMTRSDRYGYIVATDGRPGGIPFGVWDDDHSLMLGATVGNHNRLPDDRELLSASLAFAREYAAEQDLSAVKLMYCDLATEERVREIMSVTASKAAPDAVLVSSGRSFDSYVRLKAPQSKNWRNERNRFVRSGAVVKHGRLSDFDGEMVDRLLFLTSDKYGSKISLDELARLRLGQQGALDEYSRVFLCLRDNEPIGCSIGFIWNRCLFQRVAGFDYEQLMDAFEYFNTVYYAPLDAAADLGYDRIHLGTASIEAKARRGADIRSQAHLALD